jgi:putative phosphoesterase
MLVVVSDSHQEDGHGLEGRTRDAVAAADVVAHGGDFVTESALDAFRDAATRLHAVHGNADRPGVTDRLPSATTFTYGGVRIAMTHTQRGGETALALFGRERGASLVVSGHTHRPRFASADAISLLNPGSHADPRGNRPGHAELEPTADGLAGTLCTPDGDVVREFTVPARGE